VRVGDEWQLFSGEWQGPDEANATWLGELPAPGRR
jgi:hypothetical protein